MVQEPLMAPGITEASVSAGVHETDAPTFVPIVPLVLPKVYRMVCVVAVLTRLV